MFAVKKHAARGRLHWLVLWMFATLMGACGGREQFVPAMPPEDQSELERLIGGPLTAADREGLRRQLAGSDAIDEELLQPLLARLAIARGLGGSGPVISEYRRGLAQLELKRRLEEEHAPEKVPESAWRTIFTSRQVFVSFDHKDTFLVDDAQLLCCQGDPNRCRTDPLVQQCLQDEQPSIHAAYEELKRRSVGNPEEFAAAVDSLRERHPGLSRKKYGFQYDFSKGPDEQKGYDRINENVARAARSVIPGGMAEPVASNFGWHIVYLREFRPEVHRRFEDPDVRQELIERFYDDVQKQDAFNLIVGMLKENQLKVFEEVLREIDWSQVSGYEMRRSSVEQN